MSFEEMLLRGLHGASESRQPRDGGDGAGVTTGRWHEAVNAHQAAVDAALRRVKVQLWAAVDGSCGVGGGSGNIGQVRAPRRPFASGSELRKLGETWRSDTLAFVWRRSDDAGGASSDGGGGSGGRGEAELCDGFTFASDDDLMELREAVLECDACA